MAKILYGSLVKEEIKDKLKMRIKDLGFRPVLAILQVGDRPDSNIYIAKKKEFGAQIGVEVVHKKFDVGLSENGLIDEITKLSLDTMINGIIVQLPLPEGYDSEAVLAIIDKDKDADGLREIKEDGENTLVTPATARAVMSIFDHYGIDVKDKRAVVIGRSRLAGGPIALALRQRGALVEVCHKGTEDIALVARGAHILVSAAGQIGLVTKDFVNNDQIVIDVGINRDFQNRIVGDVDFASVEPLVKAITPVPGGVGPLTVACLFENLLDLCYNNK